MDIGPAIHRRQLQRGGRIAWGVDNVTRFSPVTGTSEERLLDDQVGVHAVGEVGWAGALDLGRSVLGLGGCF